MICLRISSRLIFCSGFSWLSSNSMTWSIACRSVSSLFWSTFKAAKPCIWSNDVSSSYLQSFTRLSELRIARFRCSGVFLSAYYSSYSLRGNFGSESLTLNLPLSLSSLTLWSDRRCKFKWSKFLLRPSPFSVSSTDWLIISILPK